jgi:hypothetical protein
MWMFGRQKACAIETTMARFASNEGLGRKFRLLVVGQHVLRELDFPVLRQQRRGADFAVATVLRSSGATRTAPDSRQTNSRAFAPAAR